MLTTKKIINEFNLEVINETNADFEKEISGTTHRFGLELSGEFNNSGGTHNIIAWGSKENNYLTLFTEKVIVEKLRKVINKNTPLILLSRNISGPIEANITRVANEFNVAVSKSEWKHAEVKMKIDFYVIKELSETTSIHGSLISINGLGVMIIGKSGIGKSEALLELIDNGNLFISDDTVVIKKFGQQLIGYTSPITKGFIESRGLGLINVPLIYGTRSTKDSSDIDLVIELLPTEYLNKTDRLGNLNLYYEVLDIKVPKIQIPVKHGRNVSSLIQAATNVFVAKQNGHDPLDIIRKRGW